MNINILAALGTILSGLAAAVAVLVAIFVYRGQSALSSAIHASQKKLSEQQLDLTKKIHENQTLLSQRQLLIPLWEYISTLNQINPQAPVTPHVLKVVNTLELVALSVEGGMVDSQTIKRTFHDRYLELYEQVEACQTLPGLPKSGRDLLRENPATQRFYNELKTEHMNKGKIQ